jgi:hypothetical protein
MKPVSGSVGAVSILNTAPEGTEAIDSNTHLPTPGVQSVRMNQYIWLPVTSLEALVEGTIPAEVPLWMDAGLSQEV